MLMGWPNMQGTTKGTRQSDWLACRVAGQQNMGCATSKPDPVPRTKPGVAFEGKARLCMAVMSPSHNAGRARRVVNAIEKTGTYDTWHLCFPRSATSPFYDWVEELKTELPEEDRSRFGSRKGWSSPFAWLELPDGSRRALGGRDDLCDWAIKEFASDNTIVTTAKTPAKDYADSMLVDLKKPGNAKPAGLGDGDGQALLDGVKKV